MNLSEVSDKILLSMYKEYDSEKDYNGSIGISLASELESRAGMDIESREKWIKNVEKYGCGNYNELIASEKDAKLIEYVQIAEKENLIMNNSNDALNKKKSLLHKIGIHNVYVKRPTGAPFNLKCPVEYAPEEQICSIFNKYYYQGLNLKEKYNLK